MSGRKRPIPVHHTPTVPVGGILVSKAPLVHWSNLLKGPRLDAELSRGDRPHPLLPNEPVYPIGTRFIFERVERHNYADHLVSLIIMREERTLRPVSLMLAHTRQIEDDFVAIPH